MQRRIGVSHQPRAQSVRASSRRAGRLGACDTPEEERRIREAALDKTIADSFPASDPPSSDPNPDDHSAIERECPADAGPQRPNP